MNIILFDDTSWNTLLPLTFTRPVAEIRIGALTISEKWKRYLGATEVSYFTQNYLSRKFPCSIQQENLIINASVLPNELLAQEISQLKDGQGLFWNSEVLAVCIGPYEAEHFSANNLQVKEQINSAAPIDFIRKPWDLFSLNGKAIQYDFDLITKGRETESVSDTNTIIGNPYQLFFEPGAKAEACIFNTETGPIYIGKEAEVMEGSIIRGPFVLCEHSQTKLATKIYGPTTIGPYSKVGGEINNSVIFGYTNKAHDGFLGNSVLGEWCNLGADTNNSNLKNNYGKVKAWSYEHQRMEDTGLQFCGLIMGDHSKSGINTMFNTGTVVGVSSNVFGGGFPQTHIPSFAWGGAEGFEEFRLEKAFEVAERVVARRGLSLSEIDLEILSHVQKEYGYTI